MSASREHSAENSRKTYRTPRVVVYGDIRAITRANDNKGNNDNGTGSMDKT